MGRGKRRLISSSLDAGERLKPNLDTEVRLPKVSVQTSETPSAQDQRMDGSDRWEGGETFSLCRNSQVLIEANEGDVDPAGLGNQEGGPELSGVGGT